jgi:glyceraldehyde 3-phosphate dehydrogenase
MPHRIAINGFGRVGRQTFKAIMENPEKYRELDVVAVNDITDVQTNAHLLKYDSTYGKFKGTIEVAGDALVVNGHRVAVLAQKEPAKLPWRDMNVELVLECTPLFTDIEKSSVEVDGKKAYCHIAAGAKKVIISAPAKGEDVTIVMGVNEKSFDPSKHHVISNASCTTNCLAPVAYVLQKHFGIQQGFMTTVHAYTNDQKILDLPHKDLRRARAAAGNIVPTTTGAAKAIYLVLPELKGKMDGIALRVPIPTVSIVDLVATVEKPIPGKDAKEKAAAVNAAFRKEAEGELKGILEYSEEPLVSSDIRGDESSAVFDALLTSVLGDRQVKVLAWYDNEWAYSVRLADLALFVAAKM